MKYKTFFMMVLLAISSYASASGGEMVSLLTSSNPEALASVISQHHYGYYLMIFFGLGVLLAFTPCVLPMVPILSGVIARQGQLDSKGSAKLSCFYVLGMAFSYAIAGMVAAWMGSSVQAALQKPLVIAFFCLILIFMGLALLEVVQLTMPSFIAERLSSKPRQGKGSPASVMLMGALATLVVSPCVTAPLIGVLAFIAQSGQVMLGGMVLFVMALGMGLPLILFAAGQGALLPKAGQWMNIVKLLFGYMMFAMALWLSARVLASPVVVVMGMSMLFAFLLQMGAMLSAITSNTLKFGMALLLIMLANMISQPLQHLNVKNDSNSTQVAQSAAQFKSAANRQELNQLLLMAAKVHKPVFVEFYATWCEDCVDMDEKTLANPEVIAALQRFERIKVNISDDTEITKAFKKAYHVYGTPMLLFYDSQGQSMTSLNAAGFVNKDKLIQLLKEVS